MRFGSKLRWFNETSQEYIYGSANNELFDWRGCVSGEHGNEQWIELVGRILYRETKDRDFSNAVVEKLAKKYNVDGKLRETYIHPLGYEGGKND
jgi:hypothetical protein